MVGTRRRDSEMESQGWKAASSLRATKRINWALSLRSPHPLPACYFEQADASAEICAGEESRGAKLMVAEAVRMWKPP